MYVVLGNLNQSKPGGWRVGDTFPIGGFHTMLFTAGEIDEADLPAIEEARAFLRRVGRLGVQVFDIKPSPNREAWGALDYADDATYERLEDIRGFFKLPRPEAPVMVAPAGSGVRSGWEYVVGYASLFEALGDGSFRLLHDYPLERSGGPRFEYFRTEPSNG